MEGNNHFVTTDIYLACYLKTKGIQLTKVIPPKETVNTGFPECAFIFEPFDSSLLNEWLAGSLVKTVINEYRHLLRTAREISKGVEA